MFVAELEMARGLDPRVDDAINSATTLLIGVDDPEYRARRVVEDLAVAWAGTLLARHGSPEVFDVYAASRLTGDHGSLFGTLPMGGAVDAVARRALPIG
jgi:putative acyl-CoA dehydrogenase